VNVTGVAGHSVRSTAMKRNYILGTVTSFLITVSSPAFSHQTSKQQTDPLIEKGGEVSVYIGRFLIIVVIAAIVGILSRWLEHAVFFFTRQ
jgi:hypothetical protein